MIPFETIFTPRTVRFVHDCQSRKSALQQAAQTIHQARQFIDSRKLLESLTAREELGCTVIDDSKVALPHCRLRECPKPVGALLRFKPDVPFGNAGDVALAFTLVVPLETNTIHLQILKTIAEVCSNPVQLSRIMEARTPTNLRDTFLRCAQETT